MLLKFKEIYYFIEKNDAYFHLKNLLKLHKFSNTDNTI